jgi:hypothetical protein
MKGSFTGYRIPAWWVFPSQHFNTSSQPLLARRFLRRRYNACLHSSTGGFIQNFFFFRIFFLIFDFLWLECVYLLFWHLSCLVFGASWIYGLGKIPSHFPPNPKSLFSWFFLFFFRISILHVLHITVVPQFLDILRDFFQPSFFLFFSFGVSTELTSSSEIVPSAVFSGFDI